MEINTGDTAWVLIATALVTMMTPALAFFYGGMVRKKNILSTLNLSIITMGLISLQWVLFGYTLAFGPSINGLIGGLNHLGLEGIGAEPNADYSTTIPALAFAAFQMTFAVITPALITGAFVERVNFKAYLVFALLWSTLVYDPLAHSVWAVGGICCVFREHWTLPAVPSCISRQVSQRWLSPWRFAPGVVLAACLSKRTTFPFTVLGAGLLWVGWFGFNGGSALGANGLAVAALVNSNTAAAAAAVVWMFLAWNDKKPSVLGIVTGAVVGLVAITPGSGFVTPLASIAIGAIAAPISYYAIKFIHSRRLDESLDVFACHGMAGVWGALATGLFATTSINEFGFNGLFYGNPNQLVIQLIATVAAAVFAFVVTFILAKILDAIFGLSVSTKEEEVGLDISEHGERAYS